MTLKRILNIILFPIVVTAFIFQDDPNVKVKTFKETQEFVLKELLKYLKGTK